MEKTPRINNIEWLLFLLTLGLIDLLQFAMEQIAIWLSVGILLAITEPLNIIIDTGVAILMPLYLRLRGQKVTKPGQIVGLMGTFVFEMIPGVEEFPLWIMDGFWYMYTIKKGYREEDAQIAQDQENQARAEEEAANAYQIAAQTEQQEEFIEAEAEAEEEAEEEREEEASRNSELETELTQIENEEDARYLDEIEKGLAPGQAETEEELRQEEPLTTAEVGPYKRIKNDQLN